MFKKRDATNKDAHSLKKKKKKTWVMFRGLNQEKQYPD